MKGLQCSADLTGQVLGHCWNRPKSALPRAVDVQPPQQLECTKILACWAQLDYAPSCQQGCILGTNSDMRAPRSCILLESLAELSNNEHCLQVQALSSLPCVCLAERSVPFKTEALFAHRLCDVLQTRQAWMHTRIKLETAAHQSPAEHG